MLGLALASVFVDVLRREWMRASVLARASWVLLAAGAVTGIAIVFVGAAGRFRWLLPTHILLSIVGGVPLFVQLLRASLRQTTVRLARLSAPRHSWSSSPVGFQL